VPAALAVARDGSYWIADSLKERVAHFDHDGAFVEAVPVAKGPADLAFVGDRLYVLLEEGKPALRYVSRGHLSERISVSNEGKPLHVQGLIGGQDDLLVVVAGANKLLGSYWALATVEPRTGQVTAAPGAHVPGERHMDFVPMVNTREPDYRVSWFDGVHATEQRTVRFQLVRDGKELQTSVGDTYLRTSTSAGFATLVNLSGGQGIVAGRWYLEIPASGEQPIFERVSEEGFIGDALRYLAVGDDGNVYWMRLLEDGLHIYRR
jgi:hypothetical protein